MPAERLAEFDELLTVDPDDGMTRFAWLRALPEAPGEKNLIALIYRLHFVRNRSIDPRCGDRIHPARWE